MKTTKNVKKIWFGLLVGMILSFPVLAMGHHESGLNRDGYKPKNISELSTEDRNNGYGVYSVVDNVKLISVVEKLATFEDDNSIVFSANIVDTIKYGDLIGKKVRFYYRWDLLNTSAPVVAIEPVGVDLMILDARYYYKPIDLFNLEVEFNKNKGSEYGYSDWFRTLLTFVRRDGTTYYFKDDEGESIKMDATQRWTIPTNKQMWINYRAEIAKYEYSWKLVRPNQI